MSIDGKTICFTGTISFSRAEAKSKAEAAGAKVASSLTKACSILVAGADAGKKIAEAQKKGVEVWDEAEFTASLDAGDPPPKKAKKAAPKKKGKLGAAQSDDDDDDDDDDNTGQYAAPPSKGAAKKRKTKAGLKGVSAPSLSSMGPAPVTGAAVDGGLQAADPRLFASGSIFQNYSCKLSLVDPSKNSDKYYILQVIVDGARGGHYVFKRWGRTGTSGQCSVDGPSSSSAEAVKDFEATYKTKSKVMPLKTPHATSKTNVP